MASQTFTSGTVVTNAWFVDVNSLVWGVFNGATTAALARTALGVSTSGSTVFTGTAAQGRTALGSTTVGDAVFVAASTSAARTAIAGAGSGANGDVTSLTACTSVSATAGVTIKGTTTNDSASSGNIGEYISSTILRSSGVALSSTTSKTITSISLTAGDWDVWATFGLEGVSTTVSTYLACISLTNNTIVSTSDPNGGAVTGYSPGSGNVFATGNVVYVAPIGMQRISVASTTTVYLVINAQFSANVNGWGFIGARRVR